MKKHPKQIGSKKLLQLKFREEPFSCQGWRVVNFIRLQVSGHRNAHGCSLVACESHVLILSDTWGARSTDTRQTEGGIFLAHLLGMW